MKVILSPRAEKQLRKLPKVAQIAAANKIRSMKLPDLTIGVSSPRCFVGSEIPPKQKSLRIHPRAYARGFLRRGIRDGNNTIGEEKLGGYKNIYRIRIGDYRIVYRKTVQELYVILIHHRKDVYRLLRRLFD